MEDKSLTTFCPECRQDVTYTIKTITIIQPFRGDEYTFEGKVAYCDNCGEELYFGDINDYNLERFYEEYQKRHPDWHMPSGWLSN